MLHRQRRHVEAVPAALPCSPFHADCGLQLAGKEYVACAEMNSPLHVTAFGTSGWDQCSLIQTASWVRGQRLSKCHSLRRACQAAAVCRYSSGPGDALGPPALFVPSPAPKRTPSSERTRGPEGPLQARFAHILWLLTCQSPELDLF